MNARETAWRVFASEINASTLEIKAVEEKAASYVVSPLGAKINRVLIAGVLTEKEMIGTEDDPMWRGRIHDAKGDFFINVGRYQPAALTAMAELEAPCYVAAVGKIRSYTGQDGKTYVSIRPEQIVEIDERLRREWLLETAKSTWKRLNNIKAAIGMADAKEKDLVAMGMSEVEAFGTLYALDNYGEMPDSRLYLGTIQEALRIVLPDSDVDLGFPMELNEEPDEIDIPQGGSSSELNHGQMEDTILNLLEELDIDGKGAPRDELERRAESEGISSIDLEEISNILMDKGLVYEPNLRDLKRI